MIHADYNLVLKYCEALDEFVKIRVFSDEDAGSLVRRASDGDKSHYQNEIIRSCIADYNGSLEDRLDDVSNVPALEDLQDLMYLLCIDVNPTLDIHQVSLQLSNDEEIHEPHTETEQVPDDTSAGTLTRFATMEDEIRRRVIGQDSAVDTVCKAVKKAAVGLRDPDRPVGAFLFVGHVGVGKTELAKAVADYLYDSPSRMIRVDCSEYALPHEYAKLIGSPPGYIGHNEGGYLTEAAKEMGEFVVLFDEIEKAHSKMHNILLQLLDEGMVTDSKGFKVSFRNAIVLMTSNLGVREVEDLRSAIGFDQQTRQDITYAEREQEITGALKKAFRPEFLNRLDDVLVFNTLTLEDSVQIVDKMMGEMAVIASRAGLGVTVDAALKQHIAEVGFRPEYGARELRRTIKRLIEEPLTDQLLSGELNDGDLVHISLQDGAPCISKIDAESLAVE